MRRNRLMCFAIIVAASLWTAANTQAQTSSALRPAAPITADSGHQRVDGAATVTANNQAQTPSGVLGSLTVSPIATDPAPLKPPRVFPVTDDIPEMASTPAYRLAYVSEWQRWALILREDPKRLASAAVQTAAKAEILRVLDTASDARCNTATAAGRGAARKEIRMLVAQTRVENWNTMAAFVEKRAAALRANVNHDEAIDSFSVLLNGAGTQSEPGPVSAQAALVPLPINCESVTVTLSFSGAGGTESGKAKHSLSLKGSGDITITATLSPAGTNPSVLTWTGGVAGADNLHRIVHASSPGDTDVTATAPDNSDTIRVHVIDATAPPAAAVDAPKTHTNAGYIDPGAGNFGLTDFSGNPTYSVDPYFDASAGRWYFRLHNVDDQYRQGVHSLGRIDLPSGNPPTFPLAPGMDLTQSHSRARSDLDTTGLAGTGPLRLSYWVQFITQDHENAHAQQFYSDTYYGHYIGLFESDDVESTSTYVTFDCNNTTTTTGAQAVASKRSGWDTAVANRKTAAWNAYSPTMEAQAHAVSNPEYVPIHDAIPNP